MDSSTRLQKSVSKSYVCLNLFSGVVGVVAWDDTGEFMLRLEDDDDDLFCKMADMDEEADRRRRSAFSDRSLVLAFVRVERLFVLVLLLIKPLAWLCVNEIVSMDAPVIFMLGDGFST